MQNIQQRERDWAKAAEVPSGQQNDFQKLNKTADSALSKNQDCILHWHRISSIDTVKGAIRTSYRSLFSSTLKRPYSFWLIYCEYAQTFFADIMCVLVESVMSVMTTLTQYLTALTQVLNHATDQAL